MGGRTTWTIFAGTALLAAVVYLHGGNARADEIADFQFALNAYDSGDYKTAIERFTKLLEKEITNTALLVEIRKYLGASYMFTGKPEEARKQFKELVLEDPDYELDPVLFPTEVLDEFFKVKQGMLEELKKIEDSKKKQQEALVEKKKKLIENWAMLVQAVNHPPYVRQNVKTGHMFFAFIPFGIGQFQNGHNLKGYLFLSGEAALLIANVTTYWLSEYYYRQAAPAFQMGGKDDPEYKGFIAASNGLAIACKVTFWLLMAAVVGGIVDALIFFKKKRVTYETVKEGDIPEAFRAKPVEVPFVDLDEVVGGDKNDEKP